MNKKVTTDMGLIKFYTLYIVCNPEIIKKIQGQVGTQVLGFYQWIKKNMPVLLRRNKGTTSNLKKCLSCTSSTISTLFYLFFWWLPQVRPFYKLGYFYQGIELNAPILKRIYEDISQINLLKT